MKGVIILFPVLSLVTIAAHAQPVLTRSNIAPRPGDSYPVQSATYQAPGIGGPNAAWDFSSLQATGGSDNVAFSLPSAGVYSASFPTATILRTSTTGEFYYREDSVRLETIGAYVNSNNLLTSYENFKTVYQYPLTYSSQYTDTFRFHYSIAYTGTRTGYNNVSLDGWGQLTLPGNAVFKNVLRSKEIQDYVDSINAGSTINHWYDTTYNYYVAGIHYPLLTLRSVKVGSQYAQFCTYYAGKPLGIGGNSKPNDDWQAIIAPNPLRDHINIRFVSQANTPLSVLVYDMTGRNLKQENIIPQPDNNFTLDCHSLPPGLIWIEIRGKAGKLRYKMLHE